MQIDNPYDLHIDGIIQRFEFTFDLAYQAIEGFFLLVGIDIFAIGGKELMELAFNEKLICDKDIWIQMLETRLATAENYSYDESRKIYLDIKNNYVVLLEKLCEKLKRSE